jgi:hypothetical protein
MGRALGLQPPTGPGVPAKETIALIGGLVVALFTNFTALFTQEIPLSPLAIAFLVGYGVEIFFAFLDAFLDTLKKVRT